MKPGIYQRGDGTVYWLHEDGRWQYLSPLFGEWLEVFDQHDDGQLERYPRNLATWRKGDSPIRRANDH
jgi:hypothetical protein